jgi:hypothetical protein
MDNIEEETQWSINPKIFENMILEDGKSLQLFLEKGSMLFLYFPFSIGSPYCQRTFEDLHNTKEFFEKENIIPIVCHKEKNEIYQEFLQTNDRIKKYSTIKHLERNEFEKEFKMEKETSSLWDFAQYGMMEYARLRSIGISPIYKIISQEDEGENILSCIFIIKDDKVVFEYRKTNNYQRFDFNLIKDIIGEIGIKFNDLEDEDFCLVDTKFTRKTVRISKQSTSENEDESPFILSGVSMVVTEPMNSYDEFQTYLQSMKKKDSNLSLDSSFSSFDSMESNDDSEIDHPDILNLMKNVY